jgi:hypothetical protein
VTSIASIRLVLRVNTSWLDDMRPSDGVYHDLSGGEDTLLPSYQSKKRMNYERMNSIRKGTELLSCKQHAGLICCNVYAAILTCIMCLFPCNESEGGGRGGVGD